MDPKARRTRARSIALALALLAPTGAGAWSDGGHLVTARIAFAELRPATRARVERLAALLGHTPAGAGLVLDRLRERGIATFDRWHYVNLPYASDGRAVPAPAADNVVTAIERFGSSLGRHDLPPLRRAFALAALLHLVADAHQPMHCVNLYSDAFPDGDRGGNDFALAGGSSLHRLWDGGAGALDAIEALAGSERERAAARMAEALRRDRPRASLTAATSSARADPARWAEESHALARDVAYAGLAPGDTPSPAYLERAREVVAERLTLAGYRLADLLERALGEDR